MTHFHFHFYAAIPFLDVQINVNQSTLEIRIWKKPTHTGVFLKFNASCFEEWKTDFILCLFKRAKIICSTNDIVLTEIEILLHIFQTCGYPNGFFDRSVEKFLKIKAPQLKDNENVYEEKMFFSVPYSSKSSQLFTKHYLG